MKLHLACGANILSGWTNVDLEPQEASVIQHDLTEPLPFPDETFDFIYSEHFIECIAKDAAYAFIAQCFLKLKAGGTIRISTPSLERLVRQFEYERMDSWRSVSWIPSNRADLINQGMTAWGHKYLYNWQALETLFRHLGFISITRKSWGSSDLGVFNGIESRPNNGEIILEATKPTSAQLTTKRPKVSVVIPSYNHCDYVAAAINSVLNQTFQDFEIVVTDDGSSDGTPDIVATFTDPRIKLKRFEKNKGACWATNDAIRRAQGDYIAVLNSDDEFLPEKLQKQVALLDSHPEFGAVFAYPEIMDEEGNVLSVEGQQKHAGIFNESNKPQAQWLSRLLQTNCLCHPTVLIRRTCYDAVGLYSPNLRSLPDYEMWVRVLLHTNIYIIQEPLIRMRIFAAGGNESGQRPDQFRRMYWEHIPIIKRLLAAPHDLWREMLSQFMDVSELPQIENYQREFEFAALCTKINGLSHLMAAMQVISAINDDSEEAVIPICRIYNELAAHLEFSITPHKALWPLRV
ncbi:glycosyltransferase [Aquirhabdus parva]|nr:glycosyltransferase [Aquirhabdus parva]